MRRSSSSKNSPPLSRRPCARLPGCVPVFGKINGYAPYEGELSPAVVAGIMVKAGFLEKNPFDSPHLSRTSLCALPSSAPAATTALHSTP